MIPTPPAIHYTVTPLQVDRFLKALAAVESGNNWSAVGEKGERSIYQFKRKTWYQYGNVVSFDLIGEARFHAWVYVIAVRHVAWIETVLESKRLPITPENVATVWRFGLAGGCRLIRLGKIPDSSQRVRTLYDRL